MHTGTSDDSTGLQASLTLHHHYPGRYSRKIIKAKLRIENNNIIRVVLRDIIQ